MSVKIDIKTLSSIENLPVPIQQNVFSFLDLKGQSTGARVCKAWNGMSKESFLGVFLALGKKEGIRSLTLKEPSVSLFDLDKERVMDIRDDRALLISKELPTAKILNLQSGGTQSLNLSKYISNPEKILIARQLSSSKFITVESACIKIWDLEKGGLEKTEEIGGNLAGARWIESESSIYLAKEDGSCFVFDFQTETLTSLTYDPENVEPKYYENKQVVGLSSTAIFVGSQAMIHPSDAPAYFSWCLWPLKADRLEGPLWDYPDESIGFPELVQGHGFIGANEEYVVRGVARRSPVWTWQDPNLTLLKVSFKIIDARTGYETGTITEDFTDLAEKFNHPETFPKISWLRKEFLFIWKGKQLFVWHLPSQTRISTMDLEKFCEPDELDNQDPDFCPIEEVEIKGTKICLSLQNRRQTQLRAVVYHRIAPANYRSLLNTIIWPQKKFHKGCLTHLYDRIRQFYADKFGTKHQD